MTGSFDEPPLPQEIKEYIWSFNYDCSVDQITGAPTVEKAYDSVGYCSSWGSNIGDCTVGAVGWEGYVPNCGDTGYYLADNDSCSGACILWGLPTCCVEGGPSYATLTQTCR